jgi:hypothetical protein
MITLPHLDAGPASESFQNVRVVHGYDRAPSGLLHLNVTGLIQPTALFALVALLPSLDLLELQGTAKSPLASASLRYIPD